MIGGLDRLPTAAEHNCIAGLLIRSQRTKSNVLASRQRILEFVLRRFKPTDIVHVLV